MERLGESSKRGREDGEVEVKKRKNSSVAVEFLSEKTKLDNSFRGGISAQERPTKPDTCVVAATTTTNESSFTLSGGESDGQYEK